MRAAIDPEGRATNPELILDDALVALRKAPKPSVDLQILWLSVAVALGQERRDVIAELVRDPAVLEAHGPVLDELSRLGQGKAAHDFSVVEARLRALQTTPWLPERLRARHLAHGGDPAAAAAAEAQARATAGRFVSGQMSILGLQFGLMVLGLATAVLVPLLRRRRAATTAGPGASPATGRGSALAGLPDGGSPFLLDRTRRVLLGWLVISSALQLTLATLLGPLGLTGAALAASQSAITAVNAIVVLAVLSRWGLPAEPRPRLGNALGLTGDGGRLRTILLWALPGIGFAVLCLQLGGLISAVFLGLPQQFQQSVELLVNAPDLDATLALGVGAVILAPLAEEALFRGFLFRNLRASMGLPRAALLSGVLFGLAHMHLGFFLPLTALGVALALLYAWSGSLWVPILAHAAWNALTLVSVHVTFHGLG